MSIFTAMAYKIKLWADVATVMSGINCPHDTVKIVKPCSAIVQKQEDCTVTVYRTNVVHVRLGTMEIK